MPNKTDTRSQADTKRRASRASRAWMDSNWRDPESKLQTAGSSSDWSIADTDYRTRSRRCSRYAHVFTHARRHDHDCDWRAAFDAAGARGVSPDLRARAHDPPC